VLPLNQTTLPVIEEINEASLEKQPVLYDGLTPTVLDFDFLLRLCISADKSKRTSDEMIWSRIENYTKDLVWARYATMLFGSKIFATGKGYILVSVSHAGSASEINSPDHELKLASFAKEILGESHKIFAVTEADGQRLTQLYLEKKRSGELPEGITIKAPEIAEKTKDTKPIEDIPDSLFTIFGADNFDVVREEKK
jgi:DNA polymerase-3 subunit gamma/tau